MAGFIPGLLPTNHSQEKEFAQAYEDVLERYKGAAEKVGSGNTRKRTYHLVFLSYSPKHCHNFEPVRFSSSQLCKRVEETKMCTLSLFFKLLRHGWSPESSASVSHLGPMLLDSSRVACQPKPFNHCNKTGNENE
ncbi:hypothetical protein F2P81_023060 [Scophthalmus maximus]|uniref:Uncharacterized protein n=1 Tax=Scophthalmus maximus TaxID=52904 RepID=A0A6A4RWG6_SCOMX|nr:hypothetical protein F2P81_023060 [Scophthalmus maximus]